MALRTFKPWPAPSPGTSFTPKLKILAAEFGDGYTQPTPDGLNHIKDDLSLSWDGLTDEQMAMIEKFFRDHRGVDPFYYKPVGELLARKWTCAEWSKSKDGIWKMQAKLVESFTNLV